MLAQHVLETSGFEQGLCNLLAKSTTNGLQYLSSLTTWGTLHRAWSTNHGGLVDGDADVGDDTLVKSVSSCRQEASDDSSSAPEDKMAANCKLLSAVNPGQRERQE
jgi:hypothetical protein